MGRQHERVSSSSPFAKQSQPSSYFAIATTAIAKTPTPITATIKHPPGLGSPFRISRPVLRWPRTGGLRKTSFLRHCGRGVFGFVFVRGKALQRLVKAAGIVERLNVSDIGHRISEHARSRLVQISKPLMVRPFVLQRPEPAALRRAACHLLRQHSNGRFKRLWSRAHNATASNDRMKRSIAALS